MTCTFYLGTHKPRWLWKAGVPLFVSRRALAVVKTLHGAAAPWALDSGGFTELSTHGRWLTGPEEYAAQAARWQREVGSLDFAAPQDWMCEPFIVEKTGLTVAEHQRRTIASYRRLTALEPGVPWCPVLQGFTRREYLDHLAMYRAEGIDLASLPVVGLGSVCRRQDTSMAEDLVRELCGLGLRLHGFGFKVLGLARVGRWLASADSMAWSFQARRAPPLPGHTHKNCANCMTYALRWRERVLRSLAAGRAGPAQQLLF